MLLYLGCVLKVSRAAQPEGWRPQIQTTPTPTPLAQRSNRRPRHPLLARPNSPATSSIQNRVQQHGAAAHDRTYRRARCQVQGRLRGVVGDSLSPAGGLGGRTPPRSETTPTLLAQHTNRRPRHTPLVRAQRLPTRSTRLEFSSLGPRPTTARIESPPANRNEKSGRLAATAPNNQLEFDARRAQNPNNAFTRWQPPAAPECPGRPAEVPGCEDPPSTRSAPGPAAPRQSSDPACGSRATNQPRAKRTPARRSR